MTNPPKDLLTRFKAFSLSDGPSTFNTSKRFSDFVAMFTRILFLSLLQSFAFRYIQYEGTSAFSVYIGSAIIILIVLAQVALGIMISCTIQAYVYDYFVSGRLDEKERRSGLYIFVFFSAIILLILTFASKMIRDFSAAQMERIYAVETSQDLQTIELRMPSPPTF